MGKLAVKKLKVSVPKNLTKWLVIGPFVWGKGKTRKEAMANSVKSNASRKLRQYVVYRCEPNVYVDQYGAIVFTYHGEEKPSYLKVEEVGVAR